MFFIIGGGNKTEKLNFNQTLVCRECASYGRFEAFVDYSSLSIFFIPILKWDRKYKIRSSCCNSLYELDKILGKDLENGRIREISYKDLKAISLYKETRILCKKCGKKVERFYKFCPECGEEL